MAPARSPPYAADQWESERPTHQSRGRTRSRSVGPHRSNNHPQPADGRKSPHRKELFPNRRPPSRERYRASRDHSPPHHPRRKDHGSPNGDGEPPRRRRPSAEPLRHHSTRNYPPSRSPSPHTTKRKRTREHSPSPHRIASAKASERHTGADKTRHAREYSGDERTWDSSHRAGRQKSTANLRERSPYPTSTRRDYEKSRHSDPSRRRSPSREDSHRHSRANARATNDHPKKYRSKDEVVGDKEHRKSSHRHHRASDRSASPKPRGRAEPGRVREWSPDARRHRSPPPVEQFSQSRNYSPRLGRYSPHRRSRLSVSPYKRDGSVERPAGKPRPDTHRYASQSPEPAPYHQSRRRSFGSPERHPARAQSPDRLYAEYPSRRTRSRSANSGRSNRLPEKSRAGSPIALDDRYNRARQPPPHERYDHDSRYPHHKPAYHSEHSRGGWSGYGSRASPTSGYPQHGRSPHHSHPSDGHHGGGPYDKTGHPYSSASSRGRGGSAAHSGARSNPVARGHYQNLTWTPDKGNRGGPAPSERLAGPRTSEHSSALNSEDEKNLKREGDARKREEGGSALQIKGADGPKPTDTPNQGSPPTSKTTDSTPSKPQIKFAMKVHAQPSLPNKSNVIQSAPNPLRAEPLRPPVRPTDDRRSGFPPSGPAPSRFNRRDDWGNARYPPDRDSRGRQFPHPKDRRYQDARDSPYARKRDDHKPRVVARPVRPRRKRMVKVMRTHRRMMPPPDKLCAEWAKAQFVYHPRPDRESVVGAGTYGKVFKAHNVYLGKVVALKTLPLIKTRRKPGVREYIGRDKRRRRQDRWVKDGFHLTSLREIKLLKSISHQHENVVGIREIFLERESCNLVFDYYEFDLHGIIYSADVVIDDAMLKDLNLQIFRGLDFLHTKANILHRDIKAANILVGTSGQVKITDFGLAKHVRDPEELERKPWYKKKFEHSNRVITTPYRPPELLLGATVYGGEVDVWSAGCVLFESFFKKLPFQGTGEDADHLVTIWKVLGLPNVNTYPEVVDLEWYWLFTSRVKPKKSIFAKLYKNRISPQLFNLLRCIFQHDPKKRPTAAQVLTHPFFTTEEPLPRSASAVLETVEGEWHELEYKMIRDMEKASARRRHEDNVVLGFLAHKMREHEQRAKDHSLGYDLRAAQQRTAFYQSEMAQYKLRMEESRRTEGKGDEDDNAKQVAEMKRTHGDMYMDSGRRGRYRGPAREKADEKLVAEAWKWYEDEKKKGLDPVPVVAAPPKAKKTPKAVDKPRSMPNGGVASSNEISQEAKAREERKRIHALKMREYEARRAEHLRRKARAEQTSRVHSHASEKRAAMSPLVDEPLAKKSKD